MESSVRHGPGEPHHVGGPSPGVRDAQEESIIRVPAGASLADAERILIPETLAAQGGNKSRTAEVLGIGRKTLYQKLQEYGIETGSQENEKAQTEESADPARKE